MPLWAKVLAIVALACACVVYPILVFGMAMQYSWVRNGFIGGVWGLFYGLVVEHRFYWNAVARMVGGIAPAVLIYSMIKLLELWRKRKE